MALPLPDTAFTDEPTSDISLPVSGSIGDSIDSGQLDLSSILEKSEVKTPNDTIKGAPESFFQQQAKIQAAEQSAKPQTNKNSEQLNKIEAALANIDEKISALQTSAKPAPPQKQAPGQSKVDESLIKNETDDGGIVEVVKKEATTTNRNTVTNRDTFTKEKINELLEQRNMLIQERQQILSNGITNTLTKNETTSISNNETEIIPGEAATTTPTTPLRLETAGPQNNTTDIQYEGGTFLSSNNSQTNTSNPLNNIQQDNSQIYNDTISQVENTNNSSNTAGSPITNIENRTMGNTINEGSVSNSTTVLPEPQNETSDLPSPKSEVNENSENIAQILNGIKQGIDSLPEKLGSNFQRLGSTLEGIKSNVINNQYNNSQNNSFAGGQSAPSQGGKQRATMPDYNTELPNAGDFPPNFDMASLGGTNLPNPQFIT